MEPLPPELPPRGTRPVPRLPQAPQLPPRNLQNHQVSLLSPELNMLNSLHSNKNSQSGISLFFGNVFKKKDIDEKKQILSSYRNQENVMQADIGSNFTDHSKYFITNNQSKNFNDLSKGIGELNSNYHHYRILKQNSRYQSNEQINQCESIWINIIKTDLGKLQNGDSLWINSASLEHSMIMRIEKCADGTFNLYFANTGSGIYQNPDFHPVKINEDGTSSVRLVAKITKIPESVLINGDFIEDFVSAQFLHINCTNSEKDELEIQQMYEVLRTLKESGALINDVNDPANKDSRYWGLPQTTGSCTVSGMWAMARTVLSVEEFQKLQIEMQIKSLTKYYKYIKSGRENSNARKMMILDLIQTLKPQYINKKADLDLLTTIEREIKGPQQKDLEMQIDELTKVPLNQVVKKDKDGSFRLTPVLPLFSIKSPLVASLELKTFENINWTYEVSNTNETGWVGVDNWDKIAFACFMIGNGNRLQSEKCVNDLLFNLENPKAPSKQSATDIEKQFFSTAAPFHLSKEISQISNARPDLAKQLFLVTLSLKLACNQFDIDFDSLAKLPKDKIQEVVKNKIKLNSNRVSAEFLDSYQTLFDEAIPHFSRTRDLYSHLKVETLLGPENFWNQALRKIHFLQPKPSQISPEQELVLIDLLEKENPITEVFNAHIG